MSSYTPASLPGGTDKTWRECDTTPPSVTLGEGGGALFPITETPYRLVGDDHHFGGVRRTAIAIVFALAGVLGKFAIRVWGRSRLFGSGPSAGFIHRKAIE
ncbi:hypothetical protein [Amycolatopsis sp. NPDC050768]|uniref:hypothetical protein n=1 Tax=Amycolatopsis sp. NPDC050768 TaxID=3154839 RepID=UPI0033C81A99